MLNNHPDERDYSSKLLYPRQFLNVFRLRLPALGGGGERRGEGDGGGEGRGREGGNVHFAGCRL